MPFLLPAPRAHLCSCTHSYTRRCTWRAHSCTVRAPSLSGASVGGLAPATSAPGPGSPLPHLHRDRAHPGHTPCECAYRLTPTVLKCARVRACVRTYARKHARVRTCVRMCVRVQFDTSEFFNVTVRPTDPRSQPSVPMQMWQGRAQSRCRGGRGGPSLSADVGGVSPVPMQMWQGSAQSRCRCGRDGPSPDADVAGVSPVPVQMRRAADAEPLAM